MEAIKISVTGAQAAVENAPVLTCGMVGVPVELSFDGAWEGLQKTLVYKAGGIIRDQLDVDAAGTVPGQVLETPYRDLQIGVYGVSADGTVVIPTVWVNAGQIREGANPSGDPGTQPSLPVWQQILNKVAALEEKLDGNTAGGLELIGQFNMAYCLAPTDEDNEDYATTAYFANRDGNSYMWVEKLPDGSLVDHAVVDDVAKIFENIKDKKTIVIHMEMGEDFDFSMTVPAAYSSAVALSDIPEAISLVFAGSLTGESDVTTIHIFRDMLASNCGIAKTLTAYGAHFWVYAA